MYVYNFCECFKTCEKASMWQNVRTNHVHILNKGSCNLLYIPTIKNKVLNL